MTRTDPPVAAIFDLDDTLLSESSGRLFFRYLRERKLLLRLFGRRELTAILLDTVRYASGRIDGLEAIERMAKQASGIDVEELWDIVRHWFNDAACAAISPRAQRRLDWHLRQRHTVAICSAASQFSVLPVAEYLGVEHCIFSNWRLADGRLTGIIDPPIAYGRNKLKLAQAWATKHQIDLSQSYFYSDHHSDLPLLAVVGNPHAVNPNRRLRKAAQQRGWPILDWR